MLMRILGSTARALRFGLVIIGVLGGAVVILFVLSTRQGSDVDVTDRLRDDVSEVSLPGARTSGPVVVSPGACADDGSPYLPPFAEQVYVDVPPAELAGVDAQLRDLGWERQAGDAGGRTEYRGDDHRTFVVSVSEGDGGVVVVFRAEGDVLGPGICG